METLNQMMDNAMELVKFIREMSTRGVNFTLVTNDNYPYASYYKNDIFIQVRVEAKHDSEDTSYLLYAVNDTTKESVDKVIGSDCMNIIEILISAIEFQLLMLSLSEIVEDVTGVKK